MPKKGQREVLRLKLEEEGVTCRYPEWQDLPALYQRWQEEGAGAWATKTSENGVEHAFAGAFPLAQDLKDRLLLLPFHPYLSIPEARSVVQSLLRHWPQ